MPSLDPYDLGPGVIVGVATPDGMTYSQGDHREHWTDAERADWRRKVRGGDDFRPPIDAEVQTG